MPTEPQKNGEFRRILATFTALAMLLIGKVITEHEFVTYLREAVCDEKQHVESV